jgi:copper transport protein
MLVLTGVASALYFVAEISALVGQTATLADVSLFEALSPSVLSMVLGNTHYGFWWTVRISAAVALLALCLVKLRQSTLARHSGGIPAAGRIWSALAAGTAGLILLSIPMTGHAGSVAERAWLAILSDWLHLAATALWIGALVHFALVVWFLDLLGSGLKGPLGTLTSRFSATAKVCVAVLLASGIYNAWLHLPGWKSFITTDYGRVLSVKLLLVLPILWIAAANLRKVLPVLRGALPVEVSLIWVRRFRSLLPAEAALGLLVLAVVSVLTSLPPSSTVVAAGPVMLSQRAGAMTVSLRVDPNKVGDNVAQITLTDSDGRTRSDARRVTLYVRSLDMDMGLETIQAELSPEGGYEARVTLSMAGRWLFTVEISPPQGDTFLTEFRVPTTI